MQNDTGRGVWLGPRLPEARQLIGRLEWDPDRPQPPRMQDTELASAIVGLNTFYRYSRRWLDSDEAKDPEIKSMLIRKEDLGRLIGRLRCVVEAVESGGLV